MNDEHFVELRKLRNVVNLYFNLTLQDRTKKKEYVLARRIYLKLIDTYYQDKDDKPTSSLLCSMMGLSDINSITHMRSYAKPLPNFEQHFNILKHYVVEEDDKLTKDVIKQLLIDGKLTLTDVIDSVIDLNRLIGVGLISLGQGLNDYCKSKIVIRDEKI